MNPSSETLRTCEEILAIVDAAETHLKVMSALQLPFPSVAKVYATALARTRALLAEADVAPAFFTSTTTRDDDTEEILRRAMAGDPTPLDEDTDERRVVNEAQRPPAPARSEPPAPARRDTPVQAGNAPPVPLDDGPEGVADDVVPFVTDEVSEELLTLDDSALQPLDDEAVPPPTPAAGPTALEIDDEITAIGASLLTTPDSETIVDVPLDILLALDQVDVEEEPLVRFEDDDDDTVPSFVDVPAPSRVTVADEGDVIAMEEEEDDDDDQEATLVVDAADLVALPDPGAAPDAMETFELMPGDLELITDIDGDDHPSVDEVIVSKEQARLTFEANRKATPRPAPERATPPAALPPRPDPRRAPRGEEQDTERPVRVEEIESPTLHASPEPTPPRAAPRADPSSRFYAASAAIPTIRDASGPKPRAAAIQLTPGGADDPAGVVLGGDEEDEPIAIEGLDEDYDDPDTGDGFGLRLEEFEEYEEEEEEEDSEEETAAAAVAARAPVAPARPRPSARELGEMVDRARRAVIDGTLELAVGLFSDVLDAEPDHVEAHLGRGRLYLDLGDYARAMSDFTVAEELAGTSPEPQVAVGDLYFSRKDYRKAIEYFDAALAVKPDHAMAFCRRGISHYYRRNYKQAMSDLEAAVKLDPDIPNIKTFLGMARKKVKK